MGPAVWLSMFRSRDVLSTLPLTVDSLLRSHLRVFRHRPRDGPTGSFARSSPIKPPHSAHSPHHLPQVLSQGDIAGATVRNPFSPSLTPLRDTYPSTQLLILILDVSIPTPITSDFAAAVSTFGGIDIVSSNAGYGVLGEVESTEDEVARKLFETNFWGGMGVAREAVKVFRDVNRRDGGEKGGRLSVISSLLGILSGVALGYYAASKHSECFFVSTSTFSLRCFCFVDAALGGGIEPLSKVSSPLKE